MSIRAVEQPTLFGAVEAGGTGAESEPRAQEPRAGSGTSTATRADGQETKQPPTQGATFHAVSPLANMPLGEVCALCGDEIRPPGFVIPDYEELGPFCSEACRDRRFRQFLEEEPN